jgi:N-acetyl-1-D-myo-inositol-2-amino-2-deoxy-alpha-D-glucopyranoside deacetylase
MSTIAAPRRMLLVHAHPDDEAIGTGVTMARYVAEGTGVTLVTCTLGEEGEVLVPELLQLRAEEADQLGGYRIAELTEAMRALGVTDHRFLGGAGRWRDSGMMGTPANQHPRSFWQADLTEPVRELVAIIREVRPQVLLTYDENGGYGHPDHIQAHRVAMAALDAAADPGFPDRAGTASPEGAGSLEGAGEPWQVAKVYWGAMPRSVLQAGIDALRAAGDTSFFGGVERAEDLPFAVDDELVTAEVDARDMLDAKLNAMRAHATQISVNGPFFALSNNIGQRAMGVEYFRLVRGKAGPTDGPTGRETDLFAGLA